MNYSIYLALVMATTGPHVPEDAVADTADLSDILQSALERIHGVVERLRQGPVSPLATAHIEKDLQHATRKSGGSWPSGPTTTSSRPTSKHCQLKSTPRASCFRRLNHKTPQQVSTLFGTITLRRMGYPRRFTRWKPLKT